MKLNLFMTTKALFRKLILSGMVFLGVAGCTLWSKAPPPQKTITRPHVDDKAQQQYYNQGLEQYSKEHYGDAKAAFEHVVELAPNTALGIKAQENLRKIERILKTLEEIESR